MLEALTVPCRTIPINLGKDEQLEPEPAHAGILDREPPAQDGSDPVSVSNVSASSLMRLML